MSEFMKSIHINQKHTSHVESLLTRHIAPFKKLSFYIPNRIKSVLKFEFKFYPLNPVNIPIRFHSFASNLIQP